MERFYTKFLSVYLLTIMIVQSVVVSKGHPVSKNLMQVKLEINKAAIPVIDPPKQTTHYTPHFKIKRSMYCEMLCSHFEYCLVRTMTFSRCISPQGCSCIGFLMLKKK
eukprot:TCONS_00054265-protein